MSVAQGYEKVPTNGLVFMYDVADLSSYSGQPGTNITVGPNRNYNGYSLSTYSNGKLFETNGYNETVYIPTIGLREVQSVDIYNVYDGYGNDGNYNCCVNLFAYTGGWNSYIYSPSTTYTYQIIYRCDSGYTGANFMYHYEYTSGGSYITEYGLHDDSKREHLGGGWYHAWNTFTTNASAALGYTGLWYYYYNVRDKVSVAAISIVPGNTIRPARQLIPSNTTRSTTNALKPLAGNATLDLANVSFDSNGQIVFDGTNDCIIVPTSDFNKTDGQPLTVEVIMKPGRNAGQYQDIVVNRSDSQYNWMLYQHATDGSIQLHGVAQYKSTYIPTIGQYIHVVATVTSGQVYTLYVNGNVQQVVSGYNYNGSSPSLLCIGVFGTSKYEPYLGNIDIAKIYNQALTQEEVQQSYNKYKTRFNLS
jgi:hypothetical protein